MSARKPAAPAPSDRECLRRAADEIVATWQTTMRTRAAVDCALEMSLEGEDVSDIVYDTLLPYVIDACRSRGLLDE
jgi:hypothetical protein